MEFRFATEDDAKLLFDWANDPVTRAASFKTDSIAWDEHTAWLNKKLQDPFCYLFIVMSGDCPCGMVRIDYNPDDEEGIISYSVAPDYRGRGIGSGMLKLLDSVVKEYIGSCTLIAEVKEDNVASCRCFLKNGYKRLDNDRLAVVFSKKLT